MQDVISKTPTDPNIYYDLYDDNTISNTDMERINVAMVLRDMFLLVNNTTSKMAKT